MPSTSTVPPTPIRDVGAALYCPTRCFAAITRSLHHNAGAGGPKGRRRPSPCWRAGRGHRADAAGYRA
jgi:hypothetical protein